jgi:hypothetical protein
MPGAAVIGFVVVVVGIDDRVVELEHLKPSFRYPRCDFEG